MGKIITVVALVMLAMIIVGATIFPIIIYGRFRGGELAKATGDGSRNGCTLPDQYFVDTSIADKPDDTIKQLSDFLQSKRSNGAADIATLTPNIKAVLTMGKQKGLNPAIVLAMWFGESSYRPDLLDKAFGYGNTDSGIVNGTQGWDNQLSGIYSRLEKAKNNDELYSKPPGTDMLTRLWYNYTTQLQNAYDSAGHAWVDSSDESVLNRMTILRLLVPTQLSCNSALAVAGAVGGCPNVTTKLLTKESLKDRDQGVPKVIILHYTADMNNLEKEYAYFNNAEVDVQYEVFQSGEIAQYEPDTTAPRGALNYNQPTKDYGSGAISISIENQGHFESSDDSQHETAAQITSNVRLVTCLMNRYGITKDNVKIKATSRNSQEPYNVISHKEADARSGAAAKRGSGRSDPGSRFMKEVLSAIK